MKTYLFLSSKVGTGRVSSRSKHGFLIFFFGDNCWECLGSLNVQKMCQKVEISAHIKRFGVSRLRDFKLLFCKQLYR